MSFARLVSSYGALLMRISRKLLTDLFFLVVLFVASGATEALTMGSAGADPQGSPMMKVFWACIYLVVILRLIPRYRQVLGLFRYNKCFALLLLLAIYSTRWSVDPRLTLSKSLPLLLSALIGLDFARRYSIGEQLRLVWMVLATVMVLGVIAQVFFPGVVPDLDFEPGGAWNGIVVNKNTWARLIVLTGIVLLSRPRPTRRSSVAFAMLMVMIMALLAASRSAGGLLIMTTMLFVFGFSKVLHWRRATLIVLGSSLAALFALAFSYVLQNLDQTTALLGKDATLTGRTPIWRETLRFVQKSPVWGYGFAAFWSQLSRPGRLVREAINWDNLPHSHNGYIDLALQIGGVGLFLYFAAFFIGMRRAVRYIRRDPGQESMWPLAFLCVIFLYQLDEGTIVTPNQLIWILASAALFSLVTIERSYKTALPPQEEDLVTHEPVLLAGD